MDAEYLYEADRLLHLYPSVLGRCIRKNGAGSHRTRLPSFPSLGFAAPFSGLFLVVLSNCVAQRNNDPRGVAPFSRLWLSLTLFLLFLFTPLMSFSGPSP
ncbi:hypothetical protein F4778DRAFT_176937 [Xylariomycetidae sp. FL2044]|nr:hypothetical protein F4778DRAFT_176937 [Xylariomycetidae sp. FL2044]